MFWDITPLKYCEGHKDKAILLDTVADVLRDALKMDNIACLESALHGLGHLVYYYPKASDMIQSFIDSSGQTDPRLLNYAKAAKTGCIQ